jgi:hypothetical protein
MLENGDFYIVWEIMFYILIFGILEYLFFGIGLLRTKNSSNKEVYVVSIGYVVLSGLVGSLFSSVGGYIALGFTIIYIMYSVYKILQIGKLH